MVAILGEVVAVVDGVVVADVGADADVDVEPRDFVACD